MFPFACLCVALSDAFAQAPPRRDPVFDRRPQEERRAAQASAGQLPAASTAALAGISTDERRRGLLLTDLLIEEDRFEEAEALIVQGLEVDVDTGPWTMRLARVRISQGRLAEAADLYERVLATRGDDPGLLLQLGELAFAVGDIPRARRAFLRARELLKEPIAPYYLSEIAFSEGANLEGRRRAEEALRELGEPPDPYSKRLRLHLQARLGWRSTFEEDFGRLYDSAPRESETLAEWASVMIRYGYPEAAEEPIRLMRERFTKPGVQARWRHLEAERLRRLGDRPGRREHLDGSVRALPDDAGLRLARAELAVQERAWPEAEADLVAARRSRAYELNARELQVEVIRQSHRRAGPFARWRETAGTRALETGATLLAYPRRRLRLEASADRAGYRLKSRAEEKSLSGAELSLAREWADWTLGGSLDARSGPDASAAGPGAFFRWRSGERLFIDGEASWGRLWRESAEAAFAGARTHEGRLAVQTYPFERFYLGASGRVNRATLPSGPAATQHVLTPEAVVTVLHRPFYVGLGYRYSMVGAAGDAAFFARLPLTTYSRTQYAVLSFGRRWYEGRVRADGYLFNGHDPSRGRRFGTGAMVGFGGNFEWLLGRRWRLAAGYEHTREDVAGVGGKSEFGRLSVEWRFPPVENKS
ncbi:MAG: tetratricopeptide repeat protein [Elusimicrobia bacterium]|nr:tetratricopeptide repeat protein [Elusimicrobiota bacterium]